MKSLKLNHDHALEVLNGCRSTWRINDDKDLHVNDEVNLVDRVNSLKPETWQIFGIAKITKVLEKQLGKITQADLDDGEILPPIKDLLTKYRKFYGNQVNEETPVKIISFDFNPAINTKNNSEDKEVKLYCDGGSRGNPGPSASGFVLMDMNDHIINKNGLYLGVTTNNQAEYQSLKIGLESALHIKATIVNVYMDSMLVVNQMRGAYKVSNKDLIPIHNSVKELVTHFKKVNFQHVPREKNRAADSVVNEVLDTST